jgi:hypothetical protein
MTGEIVLRTQIKGMMEGRERIEVEVEEGGVVEEVVSQLLHKTLWLISVISGRSRRK